MMKILYLPAETEWEALLARPQMDYRQLTDRVSHIMDLVSSTGDEAVRMFTKQFDQVVLKHLAVTSEEVMAATQKVAQHLKDAIAMARKNITSYHQAQVVTPPLVETMPGVACWQKSLPIDSVGLYIPGGTAPLFSSLLMLGVPAMLARCRDVVVCSPPRRDGSLDPVILYTADLLGIEKIYKVGGAQAIAAMAYGTETIPRVDKIFGPGNAYVTRAKELARDQGTAIDMPAGPTELLVIADATAHPAFVAADLLSQAEHGPDSQVILLTDHADTAHACQAEIEAQMAVLPRKSTIEEAMKNSRLIVLERIERCFEFSNIYAPEHLIIAMDAAKDHAHLIANAGSVFLGHYSCEAAGDYATGTNHTLPTYGYAKTYSGVSVDSFVKKVSFQSLSKEGISAVGPIVEIMAEAEGLYAHKNAVNVRLKTIEK